MKYKLVNLTLGQFIAPEMFGSEPVPQAFTAAMLMLIGNSKERGADVGIDGSWAGCRIVMASDEALCNSAGEPNIRMPDATYVNLYNRCVHEHGPMIEESDLPTGIRITDIGVKVITAMRGGALSGMLDGIGGIARTYTDAADWMIEQMSVPLTEEPPPEPEEPNVELIEADPMALPVLPPPPPEEADLELPPPPVMEVEDAPTEAGLLELPPPPDEEPAPKKKRAGRAVSSVTV